MQLVLIVLVCIATCGCSAGGTATATVDNKNGSINGSVTNTATGGAGGTVQVTPTLAIDSEAFKALFPGKALSAQLSSTELAKAHEFCSGNPSKCSAK